MICLWETKPRHLWTYRYLTNFGMQAPSRRHRVMQIPCLDRGERGSLSDNQKSPVYEIRAVGLKDTAIIADSREIFSSSF